jgi:ATP/maltotriose-dependent transcriptional regulator MalT
VVGVSAVRRHLQEPYERPIVVRTRLLKLLEQAPERTVILVGPAGYGKTTLGRQWLDRVGGAWVPVTAASADIAVLARDIAADLAELCDFDTGRVETALRAGRNPADQARGVARAINSQITAPLEGWVVIDDYQYLVGNQPAEELVARIERSSKLKVLVTSRDRPSWATSRRRVHLETLEVEAGQLALDEFEVAQILPPDRRTADLRRQSRGWPAVIALAAYAHGSEMPESLDSLSATLYDYFADELFGSAPVEVQHALTELAVLPTLTLKELGSVLGDVELCSRATATGLAYEVGGSIEVHPLAREFLLTRLRERNDAHETAIRAFEIALKKRAYPEAFTVAKELQLSECIERLIVESYTELVETGRLATLREFSEFAATSGATPRPVLDLISAESALTEGSLDRAQTVATDTAAALPTQHPLKARSYIVAGRAAHLRLQFDDSFSLHQLGRYSALTAGDLNASIFGMCFSALYLEDDRIETARQEIRLIANPRDADRLRLEMFRSQLWMYGLGDGATDHAEAAEIAAELTDPWVRSAWSYVVGTTLMLRGRYSEAEVMLRSTLKDLGQFGLAFATPRVRWSLAAASLGLRRFARSESLLRMVERHPDHPRDIYAQLNARALRARLLLVQHDTDHAVEATRPDFGAIPSRGMHGEYLATRALCLAVAGDERRATIAADESNAITRSADAVVLAAAARAVIANRRRRSDGKTALSLLETASRLDVWDGLICAVRACPRLLATLAQIPRYEAELREVLIRSNDDELARTVGIVTRATGVRRLLTRREAEVMDQVRQGRTNAQIASSLFITLATVKRHIATSYRKLGARNRAEAIARYAEIESAESE